MATILDLLQTAIDLKKEIFCRWIDETLHIGDIPANEVPISLVEERPDVLHAFYHVSLIS
jgi:hypothetical protein